uniref:BPTI/Kunitz inhibitor domain-containing protein n=1 Tax=Plectus sambesii TaxID=2011161 RepID=A0A914X5I6_9BILA
MYHLLLVTVLLNVVIKTEQQRPCRLSKPDSPQHTPNGCEWQYMKATNNNCGVGKYELTCAQDVDMSCFCKPDSGSCTGAAYFYHYDPSVDRCLPFSYSGCGGNTNRFQTEDECTHNCVSWNRETKQVDALCANSRRGFAMGYSVRQELDAFAIPAS